MSAAVGASFVARAGIEPTLQITLRDRNRLAITSELLGAWAVGARNVLCLTGDPLHLGDHPDAGVVNDVGLLELIRLVRDDCAMRAATMGGSEIVDPPRYLIGAADMPLADPYDPARLEVKLDAGADVIWTQITYDVDALATGSRRSAGTGSWSAPRCIVGVVPLRSAKGGQVHG